MENNELDMLLKRAKAMVADTTTSDKLNDCPERKKFLEEKAKERAAKTARAVLPKINQTTAFQQTDASQSQDDSGVPTSPIDNSTLNNAATNMSKNPPEPLPTVTTRSFNMTGTYIVAISLFVVAYACFPYAACMISL